MTFPDPRTSPRRAARAEAERRAAAALPLPSADDAPSARAAAPAAGSNGDRALPLTPAPRATDPGTADAVAAPAPATRSTPTPSRSTAPRPGTPTRETPALTRRQLRIAARVPDRGTFLRRRLTVAAAAVAVVAVAGVAIGAAASGTGGDGAPKALSAEGAAVAQALPVVPGEGLPVPSLEAAPASATPCDDPGFTAALAAKDDAAAIAAAGGGEAFRQAVASGIAPCVPLDDPTHVWVVVNKQRPYDPVDWRPDDLVMPGGVRALEESALRSPASAALASLVRAAGDAGAGEIGYLSAFRSYSTQQSTYAGRVAVRGVEEADLESARPGYSEHQSGLTVDIVPCDGSCGTLDDVAASRQGAWVRDHAWEHGYITRYVEGRTEVTGYEPEAWHLRYIGPELARAYHEGGFTTLEEFFGLPAAPTY